MAEATKVPEVTNPTPEEKHPDGAPLLKGVASTAFWPSEAKALEIARGRVKGARRAYEVKGPDGKMRWATATHEHFLMAYILENDLKYVINEIGKPARSSAPVSADSLMSAVNSMPEAEREAIKKQLMEKLGITLPKK